VEDGFWGEVARAQPEAYKATAARHPLGRLGTPEEIANTVVFLASPAASWVTRSNLIADGGFTRRVQF
jgi:NAD(P)-dependent dehydrogenase (short-subunit alcohol dehydrogenase family)